MWAEPYQTPAESITVEFMANIGLLELKQQFYSLLSLKKN